MRRVYVAAGGALLVLALVMLVVTRLGSPSASAVVPLPLPDVLDRPTGPDDRLPLAVSENPAVGGLVSPDAFRLARSGSRGPIYVARGRDDRKVCVLVRLGGSGFQLSCGGWPTGDAVDIPISFYRETEEGPTVITGVAPGGFSAVRWSGGKAAVVNSVFEFTLQTRPKTIELVKDDGSSVSVPLADEG